MFRTKGTWPRTNVVYCHPVDVAEWPEQPEIVENVGLRACSRRGAAINVVCDRGREQRSQIMFTRARGRATVFWQSARTRKQSRPDVALPTARAHGIEELEILVDAHERYPYRFAGQQAHGAAWSVVGRSRDRRGRPRGASGRASRSEISFPAWRVGGCGTHSVSWRRCHGPRSSKRGVHEVFAVAHLRPATLADGLAALQVRALLV